MHNRPHLKAKSFHTLGLERLKTITVTYIVYWKDLYQVTTELRVFAIYSDKK